MRGDSPRSLLWPPRWTEHGPREEAVPMHSVTALIPGFHPESPLERDLLEDEELRAGLAWGAPRPGHPEGSVGRHAGRMIARIGGRERHRSELRILALVHDAF